MKLIEGRIKRWLYIYFMRQDSFRLQQCLFIILYLVYCVVPVFSVNPEVANGQCIEDQSLASSAMLSSSYSNLCAGLIKYPFFLPASFTVDILNRQAISLSNNTLLSLLPTSCQQQYKRLICASVYKECNPSANLKDNSTWTYTTEITKNNGQVEKVPIFYKQPCMSLCKKTFDISSSQCGVMINQLQLNSSVYNNNYNSYIYNCSSEYEVGGTTNVNGNSVGIINTNYLDESYTFYNSTQNDLYCNNLQMSETIVASSNEDYKGAVCQNLFDYPKFKTKSYASFSSSSNNIPDSSMYQTIGTNANMYSSSNSIYIPPSSSIINNTNTEEFILSSSLNQISDNNDMMAATFAPLLPPYYVQSYLENSLQEVIEQLPPFLTLQCQEALRVFLCAKTFMQPTTFQSQSKSLPNVSLPIVPDISLCNFVSESCSSGYHANWNSSYASFNTILEQVVNNHCSNVKVYSPFKIPKESTFQPIEQYFALNKQQNEPLKTSQTILSLETRDYGMINFNTSSNQMNISSLSSLVSPTIGVPQFTTKYGITYSIDCPIGYIYGTEIDIAAPSDRNNMVAGTGCVTDCQVPIYTRNEFVATNITLQVFIMISLIGCLFIAITFHQFRRKKKQPHVICIAVSSTCFSIIQIPTLYAVPYPERYCLGNGTPISQSNGWSACLFQAIFMQYFGLTTVLFWLVIAGDLYLKIVWRYRDLSEYNRYSIIVGWVLPIIPVIIIAAAKDVFGYASPLPWCYMGSWVDNHYDFYFFFIPILIITGVGSYFTFRVIYEIYKVNGGNSIETSAHKVNNFLTTNGLKKLIQRSKNVLLFVFFFLLIVYTLFSFRFIQYWYGEDLITAALDWQTCVFSNYLFSSQNDADATCGKTPSYTLSYWIFLVSSLVTLCGSILLVPIFGITRDNKELWRDYLYKKVYKSFVLNHPDSCLTVYCCTPLCNHKYFGCHERVRKRTSFVTPAQRRASERASILKQGIVEGTQKKKMNRNFSLGTSFPAFFTATGGKYRPFSFRRGFNSEYREENNADVELSNRESIMGENEIENPVLQDTTDL